MKTKRGTQIKNNLWEARRRRGLGLKQVALLLDQKSADEISRYEKGLQKPGLENLLKLAIIYQTPVPLLFQELFEEYREEILNLKKKYSQLFPEENWFPPRQEETVEEEFCFYLRLLESRALTELELEMIQKHVVDLANTSSNCRVKRPSSAAINRPGA